MSNRYVRWTAILILWLTVSGIIIYLHTGSSVTIPEQVPVKYRELVWQSLGEAGENAPALLKVLTTLKGEELDGACFLIATMPFPDLISIDADLLIEHIHYTYLVKNKYPWMKNMPEDVFLGYVLPYRASSESLTHCRKYFYEQLDPLVQNCRTMFEVAYQVDLWLGGPRKSGPARVHFETGEARNESPFDTLRSGHGRCGEETIIYLSAVRSVGIPARDVFTIRWAVWLSAEAARGYQWDFRQFRARVARELTLSEPETEETGLTYHPIGTGELGPNRVFVTYVTGLTSYNFRIRLNHLREQLPNRRLVIFTPSFEVQNSADHEMLARQQIQIISLRDVLTDKGLNLAKLTKGAGEGEPAATPHFPTPRGTTWADIKIRFISPEAVRISAGAVAHVYTFSEMGFSDNRKGGLPDKYWEVLHELARHKGALTWESGSDLPAPQKVIPELRTRLQGFLGLTGDPFYAYKDVRSYKSRFQISEVS